MRRRYNHNFSPRRPAAFDEEGLGHQPYRNGRVAAHAKPHSLRPLVAWLDYKRLHDGVVSTLQTQPPMVADELRRQGGQFIDLADLEKLIVVTQAIPVRDPGARNTRERAAPAPAVLGYPDEEGDRWRLGFAAGEMLLFRYATLLAVSRNFPLVLLLVMIGALIYPTATSGAAL